MGAPRNKVHFRTFCAHIFHRIYSPVFNSRSKTESPKTTLCAQPQAFHFPFIGVCLRLLFFFYSRLFADRTRQRAASSVRLRTCSCLAEAAHQISRAPFASRQMWMRLSGELNDLFRVHRARVYVSAQYDWHCGNAETLSAQNVPGTVCVCAFPRRRRHRIAYKDSGGYNCRCSI